MEILVSKEHTQVRWEPLVKVIGLKFEKEVQACHVDFGIRMVGSAQILRILNSVPISQANTTKVLHSIWGTNPAQSYSCSIAMIKIRQQAFAGSKH